MTRRCFLLQPLLSMTTVAVYSWTIPLPGGGRVQYQNGLLRIRYQSAHDLPPMPPFYAHIDENILKSIQVRDTGCAAKGYGAFAVQPLPKHIFLGFYEGQQRDSIGNLENTEYLMSLDGGATFIDGYERAQDRTTFSPVHLNHSSSSSDMKNCLQIMENGQCAFFTARDVQQGEELTFDYGDNYWRGRESDLIED